VKRSGRDEPIWVIIHMCIVVMLGISLYSYPYLKLAKTLSFLLSLMSSLQQNWRREQKRFCQEVSGVGGKGEGRDREGKDGSNNVCPYE
jgi:hypothetical protein